MVRQEITAKGVAIALLARREHARRELKAKLHLRGFSTVAIEGALDELEAEGLLSEIRYVKAYVHSRIERGYGPRRIHLELRQRKVDEKEIQRVLAEYADHWEDAAHTYYRRRFGEKPAADFNEHMKRLRHMQQRGFDMEILRGLPLSDERPDAALS